MKETLVLELLAKGRLSVEESAALLGFEKPAAIDTSTKTIRRPNKTQSVYTVADHMKFVNTYLDCKGDIKKAAQQLRITVTTLRNHIQYAGLVTVPNQQVLQRVMRWRKNHKMYLHLSAPQVKR